MPPSLTKNQRKKLDELDEARRRLHLWECLSAAENERVRQRLVNLRESGLESTRKRTSDHAVVKVGGKP